MVSAVINHGRLGHPSHDIFNNLARQVGFPQLNSDYLTTCPTCSVSKGVMKKGKTSTTTYTQPLQMIQVDLCGPFSYDNHSDHRYFLTIRDAYTRYYEVIHLISKADTAVKLMEWITAAENWFSSRGGLKLFLFVLIMVLNLLTSS